MRPTNVLETKNLRRLFVPYSPRTHIVMANQQPGKRVIVDNTASTQMLTPSLERMVETLARYANVHRGQYAASLQSSIDFERAYNSAANLVNSESWRDIILGRNATEMINLVMRCLQEEFRDGDNIVLSRLEHNSNYVPWYGVQQILLQRYPPRRIQIRVVDFDLDSGELDMNQLAGYVDSRTKLVTVTGASNFLGVRPDIKAIGNIARQSCYEQPNGLRGSYFLVDAAQLIPSVATDVQEIGCHFFAWSFHKICLPFGVGALYARRDLMEQFPPFLYGGDMIADVSEGRVIYNAAPWKYTAGTPNILGAVATGFGIADFINMGLNSLVPPTHASRGELDHVLAQKIIVEDLMNTARGDTGVRYEAPHEHQGIIGDYLARFPDLARSLQSESGRIKAVKTFVGAAINNIRDHEERLTQYALDLIDQIPGVIVYGPRNARKRANLIAFSVLGMNPHYVARRLNDYDVEARSGHHCACLAHHRYGLLPTPDMGTVRVSFGPYNDYEDVEKTVYAIKQVVSGKRPLHPEFPSNGATTENLI
jgi:cysteine desulfurase/selenocysteine lyase